MTDEAIRRKFQHNPSPAYTRAIEALDALLEESSLAEVERACAAVLSGPRHRAYAEEYGHELTIEELAAFRESPLYQHRLGNTSEWVVDGKLTSVVSQQYEDISWEQLQSLLQFCQSHHLEVSISGLKSWRYPGWSLALEFMEAKSQDKKPAGSPDIIDPYSYKKGYHQGWKDALDTLEELCGRISFSSALAYCRNYWRSKLLHWLRNETADSVQPPAIGYPENEDNAEDEE